MCKIFFIMRAKNWLKKPVSIEFLVVFRVLFGCILLLVISRTLWFGWVDKFYVQPNFMFRFYGFEWVEPLDKIGMYGLFVVLWGCALMIIIGLWYRWAMFLFFVVFVYTELLDVTHYLNHYYLISLLCFLMLWLPANRAYAVDVYLRPNRRLKEVPRWTVLVLQLQIGIVYFFAGVAKLKYDWLVNAQPLQIWLARHGELPVVGGFLSQTWVAYFMSWAGAFYDLTIAFWLLWWRTRVLAYATVVFFHTLTWLLFPIGVFPFMMMAVTVVFFAAETQKRILTFFIYPLIWILSKLKSKFATENANNTPPWQPAQWAKKPLMVLFFSYFTLQVLLPLRHFLYEGDVLWTEEGFRFSWKVMLIEKQATALFTVRDAATGRESQIDNLDYLTQKQEYMMSSQPDFILQFAHFLANEYKEKHHYTQPQVFANVRVALNGRPSRLLINPETDLAKEPEGFFHKDWILAAPPQEENL